MKNSWLAVPSNIRTRKKEMSIRKKSIRTKVTKREDFDFPSFLAGKSHKREFGSRKTDHFHKLDVVN